MFRVCWTGVPSPNVHLQHLKGLTPTALSYSILILSHLKPCLAIAIHSFKWLKLYVNCKNLVPKYISVQKFETHFIFNN